MSDLISRQAAIDAIKSIPDHEDAARANALGLAENAIMTLPAVQPEILACGEGELNVPDMDDGNMISRQAAIDLADDMWEATHDKNIHELWSKLKDLPSARPKGKWIYDNQFDWYRASCSECGYKRVTDIKAEKWNGWKYCPNCGAEMEVED